MPSNTPATECGACGARQVRLREAEVGEGGEATSRVARCQECGHQPSTEVYRENRIRDLLDELPEDSGAVWSENLPDPPEGVDGAVCVVLGAREWAALRERVTLTFQADDVEVCVNKGRAPGVGLTHDSGDVVRVKVDLPGAAVKELHQTGRWSASVGGSLDPVHQKVIVRADT